MPRVAAICVLLALLPGRAAAEWHFTPAVGVTFAKQTNALDLWGGTEKTSRTFGVSVSRFGDGILAFEGSLFYTPDFFEIGPFSDEQDVNRAVTMMGSVALTTPRLWTEYSLRPFVSGGIGWMHLRGDDALLPLAANVLGFNVGAGAIGFLSDRTGVRFEMRYAGTLGRKDALSELTLDGSGGYLSYLTASVGLVIRTGRR